MYKNLRSNLSDLKILRNSNGHNAANYGRNPSNTKLL